MFKLINLSVLSLVVVIGACASPEEREKNQELEAKQYRAQLEHKCDAFGFKSGTTAYAQCLQQADRDAIQDKKARNERANCYFRMSQCFSTGRLDCGAC